MGLPKKVKDPTRWANQQIENTKSASKDWLDGVENPARDPIAAAKAAEPKYEEAMKKVLAEKRHLKGLDKSSHADIVKIAKALGPAVLEQGVEARKDKIAATVAKLQPIVQQVSNEIQAMPDATEGDRERRMVETLRKMRTVGNKLRGA